MQFDLLKKIKLFRFISLTYNHKELTFSFDRAKISRKYLRNEGSCGILYPAVCQADFFGGGKTKEGRQA